MKYIHGRIMILPRCLIDPLMTVWYLESSIYNKPGGENYWNAVDLTSGPTQTKNILLVGVGRVKGICAIQKWQVSCRSIEIIYSPENFTHYPFQCGNRIYAYANRLDPGQPPSNSAAGLRSYLFATWSTIPNKNQAEFQGFKKQTTI